MATITAGPTLSLTQIPTASTPTTSHLPCTWIGHCLGAACLSNDDCDRDWICSNRVCSPCCETAVSAGASSARTSNTITASMGDTTATAVPESQTQNRLSTGAAVGIGIAAFCALPIMIVIGWILYRRRKQSMAELSADAPLTSPNEPPQPPAKDWKHHVESQPIGELAAPRRPAELESVELQELEGDHTLSPGHMDREHKSPVALSERSVPSQRRRFEGHTLSSEETNGGEQGPSHVT